MPGSLHLLISVSGETSRSNVTGTGWPSNAFFLLNREAEGDQAKYVRHVPALHNTSFFQYPEQGCQLRQCQTRLQFESSPAGFLNFFTLFGELRFSLDWRYFGFPPAAILSAVQ